MFEMTSRQSALALLEAKLRVDLRHAGGVGSGIKGHTTEHETHPRESKSTDLSHGDRITVQGWLENDSQTDYRDPKSEAGKRMTKVLEKMPVHDGTTYRGMVVDDKELASLKSSKEIAMDRHASTSKDQSVAQFFINEGKNAGFGEHSVMLIMNGHGRDLHSVLGSDWAHTKEVAVTAGTRYRVDGIVSHGGLTKIWLNERR